jgi:hypothetical protein
VADKLVGIATVHVLPGACTCGAKFWFGCRCREIIEYDCPSYYAWGDAGEDYEQERCGTPTPHSLAVLMRQYDAPGTDFAYIHGNNDYPAALAKARAALATEAA